jgi:hypothetical protein
MNSRKPMIAKPSLFAVMACTFLGLASAQDAKDPFAADAISSMPPTPDHLIPLDPYPEDWEISYTKKLTKHLGLDEMYLARMIVRPSFSAEYSMRVHGDAESYAIDSSKEFFVTYTISNESIWYSMPDNNSENIPKAIKPKSFKASIPAETARRVCAIWDEMIFRTHYTREGSGGLDGVTIEFASRYGHGEAWCPNDGTSPALLRDIGETLIAYCRASIEERKKLLEAINTSAAKLETHLKQQAEKSGVGQPANAPKSKSEGSEKPKPESEAHPQ